MREPEPELKLLIAQIIYYLPCMKCDTELKCCIQRLFSLVDPTRDHLVSHDLDFEPKLISLISQINMESVLSEFSLLFYQVISFVMTRDFDLQPKPETKLMTLVSQIVSLYNSLDLDVQPEPVATLINLISEKATGWDLFLCINKALYHEPEPELVSLFHQIFTLAISMNPLISLCPQAVAKFENGKFHCLEKVKVSDNQKRDCLPIFWNKFYLSGRKVTATHFRCWGCNGENHGEYEKAPVEITHPLHPKHVLKLVLSRWSGTSMRKCYCCGESLEDIFYYCLICTFVMNISCVEKPPVLSIDHSKWHEHQLVHFPRQASLTCDLCALPDSTSPFFICPPCDFVAHQSCTSLPHVIRISRHPHRISFTPSFGQGNWSCDQKKKKKNWSCGVCRREIDNNYGGYSCIKVGCLYAAHSKCATQKNVWDGTELEGVPEEIEEEEEEPFVRIRDGIIQHFSHQHHHLELDENTGQDYDENKQCHACIAPIYFGKFYSCLQCEFILHETCANLPRKMHHLIHPHLLTLVPRYDHVIKMIQHGTNYEGSCSTCRWVCVAGFFYECRKEGCQFKLHVQCATISEPLVHASHMHPLFLTSKPGEWRTCGVCRRAEFPETFNCIECDFALCYTCASLPQKVRYKHDKHMLTLSYAEETSTMTYWCELCERKIETKWGFYTCDQYCCVSLHIHCLIGRDFYMKPGESWLYHGRMVGVLPNNRRMSRPFCSYCKYRCPHKIVLQRYGFIFCSRDCIFSSIY